MPTTSQAVQLGLVGLLTRPVLKAVFPSTTDTKDLVQERSAIDRQDSPRSSYSSPDTELVSPVSSERAHPVQVVPILDAPAAEVERLNTDIDTHAPKAAAKVSPLETLGAPVVNPPLPQPEPVQPEPTHSEPIQSQYAPRYTAVPEIPTEKPRIENHYLPRLYSQSGTFPINMNHTMNHNHQDDLAQKVNGMTLDERLATGDIDHGANGEYIERPRSVQQSYKTSRPASRIGGD